MAFNNRMHPRNIYKTKKPDFKVLASKYEQFRIDVEVDEKGKVKLDFKNPAHLRALTWVLLKDDFDLDVIIPLNRLIPTVPLRLNYILWIEDIFGFKGSSQLHGIDLGCGSSCIYSLLGAKKNSWKFLAAEADSGNYENALKNVEENNLTRLINVKKVSSSSTLGDILNCTAENYDFCVCNPPFFESSLDAWGITNSRSDSRPEPNSISTASELESIYPGGEVEFVKKVIIHPSLKLRNKVMIYTTMLGKKSSVKILISILKENNIKNVSTTEFCQGNTMRWGLAWTFSSEFKIPECPKQLSDSAPLILNLGKEHSVQEMKTILENVLETLKIRYSETETEKFKCEMISWSATAYENTWIHQRRKRRKMEREVDQDEEPQRKKLKADTCFEDCCNATTERVGVASAVEAHKSSAGDLDNERSYILSFDLNLTNEHSNKALKFVWKDGDSKELLHQIFQYFKNYFEKNKHLST